VGHDISVIGFDDQRIANLYEPPLTTIRVPTEEIGYQSMLVLQKILAGGSGFGCSVLATEIVVRATTGPPPGA
jgi:DNA-binding LacI/PurR family transcriptional regulator